MHLYELETSTPAPLLEDSDQATGFPLEESVQEVGEVGGVLHVNIFRLP